MGYQEVWVHQQKALDGYTADWTSTDYDTFADQIRKIVPALGDHDKWQVVNSIGIVLVCLAKRDLAILSKVLNALYVDTMLGLRVFASQIVASALNACRQDKRALKSIFDLFPNPEEYLLELYQQLPPHLIDEDDIRILLELVEVHPPQSMVDFGALVKYKSLKATFFPDLLRSIMASGEDFQIAVYGLLNSFSVVGKNLYEYFRNDMAAVEEAYLSMVRENAAIDHDGECLIQLTNHEPTFIDRYLETCFPCEYSQRPHNHQPKPSVWIKHRAYETCAAVLSFFASRKAECYYSCEDIASLLDPGSDKELENGVIEFLHEQMTMYASDRARMDCVFKVLHERFPNLRGEFCGYFIQANHDLDDFKCLPLEANSMYTWSGTFVDIMEEQKRFWESLLPFLNTPELLEHRAYVNEMISRKDASMEYEKRRNFLRN